MNALRGGQEDESMRFPAVGEAMLAAVLDYRDIPSDEFHEWYDAEHIPERLRCPGFIDARRFLATSESDLSILLYGLNSREALDTPEYRAIAGAAYSPWTKRIMRMCSDFRRYEAVVVGAAVTPYESDPGAMLFVAMNIDAEAEDAFSAWYDEEHLPRFVHVPGVHSVHRFLAESGPHRHIVTYIMDDAAVLESAAWRSAVDTLGGCAILEHVRDKTAIIAAPYRAA